MQQESGNKHLGLSKEERYSLLEVEVLDLSEDTDTLERFSVEPGTDPAADC
jgi:hypothetical protein